jgi:hypothetical protein
MKFLELTDKPRPDDGSEPIIKAFVDFTSQKLGLAEPPEIKLHRNPKLASQRRSFGSYTPGAGIEINIGNRHIMDVLRTLAHEMVHFKQFVTGELEPDSGRDGSDQENEANAKAAVVMRLWAKMNPELFQHATILAESQKNRLTPKHIHKIADKKGIKWDDEPAFLKLTRRVAGHRYLDDLDQDGLFKMKNYLDRLDDSIQDLTYKMDEVKKRKRKIRHAAYGPGPYGLYGVNTGYSGDGGDGGGMGENFADGKNPQDKGDSARHGIPKKASLGTLDKIGHGSGRKAQLARWQANMRRGRNKND